MSPPFLFYTDSIPLFQVNFKLIQTPFNLKKSHILRNIKIQLKLSLNLKKEEQNVKKIS